MDGSQTRDIVIEMRNLGVQLAPDFAVVIDGLRVERGETVILDAESGAGKSTVLGLIAGAIPHDGRLGPATRRFAGQDLGAGISPPTRLGFVLQTNVLVSYLSIDENITLAARIAGQAYDGAWKSYLVGALGLNGLLKRRPGQISVGQRQRASIARAFLLSPDILLLDEPVSALDPYNSGKVEDLILHLAQESGAAVILASHKADGSKLEHARRVPQATQLRDGLKCSVFGEAVREVGS